MPIPDSFRVTGLLPLGRYQCTEREIRAEFVEHPDFSSSVTRGKIWNDWETARDTVRSLMTVHAVWIAGSFTTTKLDPGDVDVVFVVNGNEYDALPPNEQAIASLFARGSVGAVHHNLQVDSYMIPWRCFPIPNPGADPAQQAYFINRGYWDDFWLRNRSGPKGSSPVFEDAVPKRGYLEVSYDDYL